MRREGSMFELKCLVDDAKLAKVMWTLDGLVYELKVVPVRAAAPTRTGRVKSTAKNGDATQTLYDHLTKRGIEHPTPKDMRTAAEAAGYSGDSYSYAIKKLMDAGLLSRTREAGKSKYKLRQQKEAAA
jgi:DNA-binding transcriptional ArsR family regulator